MPASSPLEDLPVHFQAEGVYAACEEVHKGLQRVEDTVVIYSGYSVATEWASAIMPVSVTIRRSSGYTQYTEFGDMTTVLNVMKAPSSVTLKIAAGISNVNLATIVTSPGSISTVELVPWTDTYLKALAELVQKPLAVSKIGLQMPLETPDHVKISASEFSALLRALCNVPESSKLLVFQIPSAIREKITGDPIAVATVLKEIEANATAMRILKFDFAEIPPRGIPEIDPEDAVTVWLPYKGIDKFVEHNAVQFSRKRLVACSGFIRNLLNDNPDENKIPLPLYTLRTRTVSVEALAVTSQLLQCCPSGDDDKPEEEGEKATAKPVWTREFQEVFESVFLPSLEHSDIASFRRQLALKLFGEILELGRYLELPVAYNFGLVGGVATFAKRL